MFPKNRESRTISLNAQYIVAFKNPRDATQVTHLARQMYPGRVKYMQETFKDATSGPYGYLLLDLKQETPEHLRLRTNVFPDEVQYTYLPKIKGDSPHASSFKHVYRRLGKQGDDHRRCRK